MQESNLIGVRELASELRLPIAWVKVEARAGRIPCLKVGRQWLFNRQAVKSALAERAAQSEAIPA